MTASEFLTERELAIEAAVCITCGLDDISKHYPEKVLDAASKQYSHGIRFRELLMLAARENGHSGFSTADVGVIFDAAFAVRASSGYSTMNIPGILSNVANKFLNVGFLAVETGFRTIAAKRSAPDFKQSTSYSLTGDLTYELVGPAGEIKSGTLGEAKYTNQLQTYGKTLRISRTDIINDDLGVLATAARNLGRGAGLSLNQLFWKTFLGSVSTMFTSGNGNVVTGAGSALSASSLGLAAQALRKQTDPDGNPLGVNPRILLVPPELEIVADGLMHSTAFSVGGSSTVAQIPTSNMFAGKYQVLAASYLSNGNFTGYSTTAWYLLADPLDLATMETSWLNGRDFPTIETAEADRSTLGINMRAYHDVGIATQEFRAGVRAAGA